MFILKAIQIVTSLRNKENSYLFTMGELFFMNGFWVPVHKINFPTKYSRIPVA